MTKYMNIKLTEGQAILILSALEHDSMDDVVSRGEYSYYRCYLDMKKKINKARAERDNNEKV